MAAGRQRGVGYSEFRDREMERKVSRGEIGYTKRVVHDRIGGRDWKRSERRDLGCGDDKSRIRRGEVQERGVRRDHEDRLMLGESGSGSSDNAKRRIRHGEIKERGVMRDCEDRLVSGRSDSGSSDDGVVRRVGGFERGVDLEPGELFSESGSDGGIGSDSLVKENDNKELSIREKSPGQGKKRKFLPVMQDKYDKEVSSIRKYRESHVVSSLPPSSMLPMSLETCKVGLDYGNCLSPSPSKIAKIQLPEPTQCSIELDPYICTRSSSLFYQNSSEETHQVNNYMEADFVEDEGVIPLRNIQSSRWATDFDLPVGEGEMHEHEKMHNLKKKLSETLEIRGHEKSVTSELGELKPEGSSRVRTKSESDEIFWLSSKDSCSGRITDNYDMEVDEDHQYDGGSASQSDTELEDVQGTPKLDLSPCRNVNMLHGCRSVNEFERLNKINEGTYGVVYRAREKKTGEIVALKKVKMEKEREGFPLTALREINILLSLNHSSIVDVKEVVVGTSLDDIFMVMEYVEHDLKRFMEAREQPFSESEVKCLMLQLLKGTEYLHDNWVLHRDLKTSNLLVNNRFEVKICDLGLARQYGSPLKPYTQLVVTLWYRAPELLLGAKQYSTAIDMWSLGCIMAELLSKEPLFNGKSEIDQIDKIFRTLGTPNEKRWPGYSKLPGAVGNFVKNQENKLRKKFPPRSFTGAPVLSDCGFDLLSKLLTYDPEERISAEAALEHAWFQEVSGSKDIEFLPITSLVRHAQDRHMRSSGGVFG